jgi:L-alanine-DL-glutamate epimerase-like enolase superfamily enzyme
MKRDITPQAEADRFKKLEDEKGINAFKFRIGAECGRGEDEWPGRSEEIIKVINKNLDLNTSKLVDANSCFKPSRAIELGHMLEDNGVTHYEEPCPYWEPSQTLEVTNALNIDVTGGEQDCDLRIWQDMIERKIVNIVQPDVMYMGGLTRTLKVLSIISCHIRISQSCSPPVTSIPRVSVTILVCSSSQ